MAKCKSEQDYFFLQHSYGVLSVNTLTQVGLAVFLAVLPRGLLLFNLSTHMGMVAIRSIYGTHIKYP